MALINSDRPLGRRTPTDWTHVDRYRLSALPQVEMPKCVPVALGVNWYSDFDHPVKIDGLWWVAREGIKGSIRGGHCVCLAPDQMRDPVTWWNFYNQGSEGACVGFGSSRLMSLVNRRRYDARWLWDRAKEGDEWPDTNPGDDNGTSVRAAMDVLRDKGHVKWSWKYRGADVNARRNEAPVTGEGIAANRWAVTVDEVREVLASPRHDKVGGVPFLNSWGLSYPHKVFIPHKVLERLINEDGEASLITDR